MKKLALIGCILSVCLNVYLYFQYDRCQSGWDSTGVVSDTITYVDTIPYYKPIPRDSVVIRYITEKLPAAKQVEPDSAIVASRDSAEVVIPITQKEYKGEDYQAWVSGYQPSLDSLLVFSKTQEITTREKPKRWSVGLSAGYGFTPKGSQPFVGVSLTYRLWDFDVSR